MDIPVGVAVVDIPVVAAESDTAEMDSLAVLDILLAHLLMGPQSLDLLVDTAGSQQLDNLG